MSTTNAQLSLNAAAQPSDVLRPETVPRHFVDVIDDAEIQSERVEKKDDCSVTCANVVCSIAGLEYDSDIAGKTAGSTSDIQLNTIISSTDKTSSGSPVFNRQCQFSATVSVSSSPSLFDEEEEKRLHQRNMSRNLFITPSMSNTFSNITQPSPSVLSRKLHINTSDHPENAQIMNINHQKRITLISQLQHTQNKSDLQTADEMKSKEICSMKLTEASVGSKMLPDEIVHAPDDDRFCCPETIDQVAFDRNMLEVSATESNDEKNDLLTATVKQSQHDIAGATSSASHFTGALSDFQQPLPKKQRCETVNTSLFLYGSPHAVNVDNSVENNGMSFAAIIYEIICLLQRVGIACYAERCASYSKSVYLYVQHKMLYIAQKHRNSVVRRACEVLPFSVINKLGFENYVS